MVLLLQTQRHNSYRNIRKCAHQQEGMIGEVTGTPPLTDELRE